MDSKGQTYLSLIYMHVCSFRYPGLSIINETQMNKRKHLTNNVTEILLNDCFLAVLF